MLYIYNTLYNIYSASSQSTRLLQTSLDTDEVLLQQLMRIQDDLDNIRLKYSFHKKYLFHEKSKVLIHLV